MKISEIIKSTEPPISPNVLWLDKRTLKTLTSSGWKPILSESIGSITGPTSSVVNNFVTFGDENGTIVKDSGISPNDLVGKFDPTKYGEIFNSYYTGSNKDSNNLGNNRATGLRSHAEGGGTAAAGGYAHAEGRETIASGLHSHAEGYNTVASGHSGSHAEGYRTIAKGNSSHAEGQSTVALGNSSHAEGTNTQANGVSSHTEGDQTTAGGKGSHAEGGNTKAIGQYSHSEGLETTAEGFEGHAEGYQTKANGMVSHAEGWNTEANGDRSHTEGEQTTTTNLWEHAQGLMNVSNTGTSMSQKTLHSVGMGMMKEPYTNRNAHEIMCNGDHYVYGIGGYDGTNYSKARTLQEIIGECFQEAGINTLDNDNGVELFFRAPEYEETFYIPIANDTNPGVITSTEKQNLNNIVNSLTTNNSNLSDLETDADLATVITKCNQILACLRQMSTV